MFQWSATKQTDQDEYQTLGLEDLNLPLKIKLSGRGKHIYICTHAPTAPHGKHIYMLVQLCIHYCLPE